MQPHEATWCTVMSHCKSLEWISTTTGITSTFWAQSLIHVVTRVWWTYTGFFHPSPSIYRSCAVSGRTNGVADATLLLALASVSAMALFHTIHLEWCIKMKCKTESQMRPCFCFELPSECQMGSQMRVSDHLRGCAPHEEPACYFEWFIWVVSVSEWTRRCSTGPGFAFVNGKVHGLASATPFVYSHMRLKVETGSQM